MSQIPSAFSNPLGTRNDRSGEFSSALSQIDTDEFLQLMIEEMQNQDPLNPTDSSQFLQQITQIREIGSSDRLTELLDTVLQGQNLATASGLIGKQVVAMSDSGQPIEGIVDRVSVDVNDEFGHRALRIHAGDQSFSLNNIRQINDLLTGE